VDADRHRHAAAANGAQFLGHHHGIGAIEALAAIFSRLGQAEKTEVAELLEQVMGGKALRLLPFIDERVDLRGDEFLQGAARFVVLGREQHPRLLRLRSRIRRRLLKRADLAPATVSRSRAMSPGAAPCANRVAVAAGVSSPRRA